MSCHNHLLQLVTDVHVISVWFYVFLLLGQPVSHFVFFWVFLCTLAKLLKIWEIHEILRHSRCNWRAYPVNRLPLYIDRFNFKKKSRNSVWACSCVPPCHYQLTKWERSDTSAQRLICPGLIWLVLSGVMSAQSYAHWGSVWSVLFNKLEPHREKNNWFCDGNADTVLL